MSLWPSLIGKSPEHQASFKLFFALDVPRVQASSAVLPNSSLR